MGKINSKKKGNAWELAVAGIFTEKFEGEFRRAPMSGAIFGGSNRKRSEGVRSDACEILAGDIIAPEEFPYSIECKAYKELEFHHLFIGKCAKLDEWIEQGTGDAEFSGKKLLLVIKINRRGSFVCIHKNEMDLSKLDNYVVYRGDYLIISLDTFLDNINI